MRRLFLDFETFSEADLPDVGAPLYAAHPSTEGLMAAWAVDDGPVQQADLWGRQPLPADLLSLIDDEETVLHAHNARFELLILRHVYGVDVPLERVHCDAVHARSLSLPGALDPLCRAIGLGEDQGKLDTGKKLIRLFCKPRKPSKTNPATRWTPESRPDEWAEFLEYNRRDVDAERAVYGRLSRFPMLPEEWALWRLDQEINDRGYPIDRVLVEQAIEMDKVAREAAFDEMTRITGLDNPNSTQQLSQWLMDQGCPLDNLQKRTVQDALKEEHLPESVRQVLALRLDTSRAAVKKFHALASGVGDDDRLRDSLLFYGASRTGRWSGRKFQPHNLTRGSLKPDALAEAVETVRRGEPVELALLSDLVRCAIRAPAGFLLRIADLANVESRILGWVSGDPLMQEVFRSGADIYKDYGTELLGKPTDAITKDERNFCKPPCLGCGYGLGWRGLIAYADGMGVAMTDEQAGNAVSVFRSRYEQVPRLWRRLENASIAALDRPGETITCGRVAFTYERPFLFLELPSRRRLGYYRPRVEDKETPWGEMAPTVTYEGQDQKTSQWVRISTFGGKWTEQICQAISRDLLANGLVLADQLGFEVVGHVHDEIITMTAEDDWQDHELLAWAMYQLPEWADDQLYIGAEGFSSVFFRKD